MKTQVTVTITKHDLCDLLEESQNFEYSPNTHTAEMTIGDDGDLILTWMDED